jgi:hypothetical protein
MRLRHSQLIVALLVALLVAAPLVANLCHHHANCSDINCPICHFNHQPMDRPVDGQRIATIDVIRDGPPLLETRAVAAQTAPPLPSRAPPSA